MSEDAHWTKLGRKDALETEDSYSVQPCVVLNDGEEAKNAIQSQRDLDNREPRGSRGLGPCLLQGSETLDRFKSPEGPTPTRVGAPRDVPVGVGGPELDHSTL